MAEQTNVTRPNEADTTPITISVTNSELGEKLQQWLNGTTYPISKEQLIASVREKGAGNDVISLLEKLPDRVFRDFVGLAADIDRIHREQKS